MKILSQQTIFTTLIASATWSLTSCTNDVDVFTEEVSSTYLESRGVSHLIDNPESAKSRFGEILSSATYKNKELRQFLKEEALRQFDKNYDVLYAKVKDTKIGGNSFKAILNKYAKPGELDEIFNLVPNLNIHVPKISMFNISAENLNIDDEEIPVVIPQQNSNILYLNGQVVDSIAAGDVPAFHVFVINNNSRVFVNRNTRSSIQPYEFIDEAFNGEHAIRRTRNSVVNASLVGQKAVEAFKLFNKNDGSNQSIALQRDYIYYGMTPNSTKGSLNRSVTEYLTFIEVNPKTYFKIAEKAEGTKENPQFTDDPYINKNSTSRKKRDFTREELINEFWTKGAYNFRVEVLLSNSHKPYVKYIPVKPDEIWNFNYDRRYRHSTKFRHSKCTYTIDPNKFTAKRYDISSQSIDLQKWDLSEEGLTREVYFYEEDPNFTIDLIYKMDITKMKSSKISGDTKYELGISIGEIKTGTESNLGTNKESSTTTHETIELSTKISSKDDSLGMAKIYFYDPLIMEKRNGNYVVKTYNTGYVNFGLTAK